MPFIARIQGITSFSKYETVLAESLNRTIDLINSYSERTQLSWLENELCCDDDHSEALSLIAQDELVRNSIVSQIVWSEDTTESKKLIETFTNQTKPTEEAFTSLKAELAALREKVAPYKPFLRLSATEVAIMHKLVEQLSISVKIALASHPEKHDHSSPRLNPVLSKLDQHIDSLLHGLKAYMQASLSINQRSPNAFTLVLSKTYTLYAPLKDRPIRAQYDLISGKYQVKLDGSDKELEYFGVIQRVKGILAAMCPTNKTLNPMNSSLIEESSFRYCLPKEIFDDHLTVKQYFSNAVNSIGKKETEKQCKTLLLLPANIAIVKIHAGIILMIACAKAEMTARWHEEFDCLYHNIQSIQFINLASYQTTELQHFRQQATLARDALNKEIIKRTQVNTAKSSGFFAPETIGVLSRKITALQRLIDAPTLDELKQEAAKILNGDIVAVTGYSAATKALLRRISNHAPSIRVVG